MRRMEVVVLAAMMASVSGFIITQRACGPAATLQAPVILRDDVLAFPSVPEGLAAKDPPVEVYNLYPLPPLTFEGTTNDPTADVVATFSDDYRDMTFSANWPLTGRLCVPEGCLSMEELRAEVLTRASGGR